jgi:cell division control protein 6
LKKGGAYVKTGDAEESYQIVCENYDEKPRAHTQFLNYLKDLENAGFIDLKLSREGQRGTTHLISLPDVPASAVEKKLEELLG